MFREAWHARQAAAHNATVVPFFMYDDEVMMMKQMEGCAGWGDNWIDGSDVAFIRLMLNHPWRVQDPAKAQIHIIPIPLSASYLHANKTCGGDHITRTTAAFERLFNHPVYRRYNMSHYLHCHAWECLVAWEWPKEGLLPVHLFRQGNLSNIILGRFETYRSTASDCERYGAQFKMCDKQEAVFAKHPVTGLYHDRWELSRCAIVVPYLARPALRSLKPTFEEWRERKNTVFYQTTTRNSAWSATRVRHAPVKSSFKDLPGAVVGFGLPREQWAAEFEQSKFCLTIRGDTPTSNSLYNAIKVGCVPVIISDTFPLVGQPFGTQLPWSLFTVTLPEEVFATDPLAVARFLWQMPASQQRSLVANLGAARRALLYEAESTLGEHVLHQVAAECL